MAKLKAITTIPLSNEKAIEAHLKAGQGRATARTLTAWDLAERGRDVEKTLAELGVPKANRLGTRAEVGPGWPQVASSYRSLGTPSCSVAWIVLTRRGWALEIGSTKRVNLVTRSPQMALPASVTAEQLAAWVARKNAITITAPTEAVAA